MYAFPRSFDRGPIEAMRIERTRDTRTDYFRDHLIAAPLKRAWKKGYISQDQHFRDHLIAAPLKLGVLCGKAVCKDLFPRSFDRGPIEALSSISYRLRALIISAII